MFDRFTDRARKVMNLAKGEVQRLGHEYIGTEHLLLGLISEAHSTAVLVLQNMAVDRARIRAEIEKLVKGNSPVVPVGYLPFTPRAKKALELALLEAHQLQHNYIGTEHLLLGLIAEGEGIAARVLTTLGVTLERTREEIRDFVGDAPEDEESSRMAFHPGVTVTITLDGVSNEDAQSRGKVRIETTVTSLVSIPTVKGTRTVLALKPIPPIPHVTEGWMRTGIVHPDGGITLKPVNGKVLGGIGFSSGVIIGAIAVGVARRGTRATAAAES